MAEGEEALREVERSRLAAFVAKDVAALQRLHAREFELINPAGVLLTRDQYINGIAAGAIAYKTWEPESQLEVRLHGDAATVRYRSVQEIVVQGELQPKQYYWQTELYEQRDGEWQVVWSQATRITG